MPKVKVIPIRFDKYGRPVVRDDRPSRQRAWQKKMVAEGRCDQCGKLRKHYPQRCDDCQKIAIVLKRAKRGSKPWELGKPGRPPKTYKRPPVKKQRKRR